MGTRARNHPYPHPPPNIRGPHMAIDETPLHQPDNTQQRRGNSLPRQNPKNRHTPKDTRHLVAHYTDIPQDTQTSPNQILSDRWHQTDNHTIIEIEWLDAISTGDDWTADQDLDLNPAPSLSIGYLISDNPTSITIASLLNSEWWGQGITIPKGCIIQTRTLTK